VCFVLFLSSTVPYIFPIAAKRKKREKKRPKKKVTARQFFIFFHLLLKEKREKKKGPRKKWEQGKKMAQEKSESKEKKKHESGEASSSGFRGGFWARATQHPPAHHPSTGCLNTGFHQITVGQSERLQGRLHRAASGAASSRGVKGGFIVLLI